MRTTNAVARKKRHKKILKLTKGYRWGRKNLYRLAKNASTKAGQHAYKGRRQKKRDFRRLWIIRISAGLNSLGFRYSEFFFKMAEQGVVINRKILADIAFREPDVFSEIAKEIMKK